jgi:hypothetical protein
MHRVLRAAIDAKHRRVSSHAATGFSAVLAGKLFFSTFECAAARATSVSAAVRHTECTYESVPDCICRTGDAWFVVVPVAVQMYTRTGRWFDVRVKRTRETRVPVPPAIQRARALAASIANPWAHPQTRSATPSMLSHRVARTLTFAAAPGWHVEFACVNETQVLHTEMMPCRTDVYEIALLPRVPGDPSVADACWLLDLLATAVAPDLTTLQARLDADWERYSREHCTSPYQFMASPTR